MTPVTRTSCAEGTLQFELVQSRGVRTNVKTGDQLFIEATTFTLCVDVTQPELPFTFTSAARVVGGTGKYAGARGTSEARGGGKYLVATTKSGVFAGLNQFTYGETGTITLAANE